MNNKIFYVLGTVAVLVLSSVGFATQTRLTSHKMYYSYGDGAGKIYFFKLETGDTWDLWRMNEDGTNVIRLTNDNSPDLPGDIFPDKTKIAFIKMSETGYNIYVINSDGTNAYNIYSTTNSIRQLKVSPDGTKIAFVEAGPEYNGTLCLINVDGTGARTLAPHISGHTTTAEKVKILSSVCSSPPEGEDGGEGVSGFSSVSFTPVSGSTTTKNNVSSEGIAFSPDSSQVVFRSASGMLAKINTDGTNLVVVSTFSSVSSPYWLKSNSILFREQEYYYGMNFSYTLYQLVKINPDGTGYTVLYSTPTYFSFSVSPDESKFVLTTEKGDVIVVSSSGNVLEGFTTSTGSYGGISASWLSNNKIVYTDSQNIFTINIDGTGLVNLTNNNLNFYGYYYCRAKGNTIVYQSQTENKVYAMNTDGTNKIFLFSVPMNQSPNYKLSPDGTKLLYSLREEKTTYYVYSLYVRNTDGTGVPVKIDEGSSGSYSNIQWSSLGTKIMCRSGYDYIVNPDGTGKKQITFSGVSYINYLLSSPDDTKIVFQTSTYPNYKICTAPVDISTSTLILSTTISYDLRDWKSNKVLLGRYDSGNKIYLMNSDGSGLKFLDNGYYYYAKLSPDGSKVAYPNSSQNSLYVINTDGSGKVKLTDSKDTSFLWSLDSQKIVYTDSSGILFSKIYIANADGANKTNLNPAVQLFASPVDFVTGNKIVYTGDYDIWVGDYESLPVGQKSYIKGYIRGVSSAGISGVTLTIQPSVISYPSSVITAESGYYEFLNLSAGNYIVTPSKTGYAFTPPNRSFSGLDTNQDNQNFSGSPSSAPVLSVSTDNLDFGEIKKGESKTAVFTLTNVNQGTLSGIISTDQQWIRVNPANFTGNSQTIEVTVDNGILNKGNGEYTGTITIDSTGGTATVTVRLKATCVLVYPNPYSLSSGKKLTFWGSGVVPNNTKIKIYTLGMDLVKTLSEDSGSDRITWNGTNDYNERVVPGIYLYVSESPKEVSTGRIIAIK